MTVLAPERLRHDRMTMPLSECSITRAQIAALSHPRLVGQPVEVRIRSGREVRRVRIHQAQSLPERLAKALPYKQPVLLEGKCVCTLLPIMIIWDAETISGRAVIDLRAA